MGKQIGGGERKREGVRTGVENRAAAPGRKAAFGPRPYGQSGEGRQAEWKWWQSRGCSGREGSGEEGENPRGRDSGSGRAAAEGGGGAAEAPSPACSPRSSPAPSRHLLRLQRQRVVFL